MSHIHVLNAPMEDGDVREYPIIFHHTIVSPKVDATFPDFESRVPDITTEELDAIKAGTIWESREDFRFHVNDDPLDYLNNRVKPRWTELEPIINIRYDQAYRFYLSKFDIT